MPLFDHQAGRVHIFIPKVRSRHANGILFCVHSVALFRATRPRRPGHCVPCDFDVVRLIVLSSERASGINQNDLTLHAAAVFFFVCVSRTSTI
jgi:hypothetical protein